LQARRRGGGGHWRADRARKLLLRFSHLRPDFRLTGRGIGSAQDGRRRIGWMLFSQNQ
jgi:hypothetical protein